MVPTRGAALDDTPGRGRKRRRLDSSRRNAGQRGDGTSDADALEIDGATPDHDGGHVAGRHSSSARRAATTTFDSSPSPRSRSAQLSRHRTVSRRSLFKPHTTEVRENGVHQCGVMGTRGEPCRLWVQAGAYCKHHGLVCCTCCW